MNFGLTLKHIYGFVRLLPSVPMDTRSRDNELILIADLKTYQVIQNEISFLHIKNRK